MEMALFAHHRQPCPPYWHSAASGSSIYKTNCQPDKQTPGHSRSNAIHHHIPLIIISYITCTPFAFFLGVCSTPRSRKLHYTCTALHCINSPSSRGSLHPGSPLSCTDGALGPPFSSGTHHHAHPLQISTLEERGTDGSQPGIGTYSEYDRCSQLLCEIVPRLVDDALCNSCTCDSFTVAVYWENGGYVPTSYLLYEDCT